MREYKQIGDIRNAAKRLEALWAEWQNRPLSPPVFQQFMHELDTIEFLVKDLREDLTADHTEKYLLLRR